MLEDFYSKAYNENVVCFFFFPFLFFSPGNVLAETLCVGNYFWRIFAEHESPWKDGAQHTGDPGDAGCAPGSQDEQGNGPWCCASCIC